MYFVLTFINYPIMHYLFTSDLCTNMILVLAFDETKNKTFYYKNLNFYFSIFHKTINFNSMSQVIFLPLYFQLLGNWLVDWINELCVLGWWIVNYKVVTSLCSSIADILKNLIVIWNMPITGKDNQGDFCFSLFSKQKYF